MVDFTHVAIAFLLGFITGVVSAVILRRKNFQTDKILSLLIVGMWLGFHSVAFFTDLTIAWMFDVVGTGAAGHIIGLDVVETLSKIRKK